MMRNVSNKWGGILWGFRVVVLGGWFCCVLQDCIIILFQCGSLLFHVNSGVVNICFAWVFVVRWNVVVSV